MGRKQLWHILRTIWHLHSKIMKNHYANSIRILLNNITLFLHFNLKHVCVNVQKYSKMVAATVRVSVTEENLTDTERLPKDSCCKKCFDLETRLQEALKELHSTHLIIELLRIEVRIGTESRWKQCDGGIVKKKYIQCDPTEKLHVKTKWSNVVPGKSIGGRREDSISN